MTIGHAKIYGRIVMGLASIDASMTELVGGKAANLGDMLAAGVTVPQGFCVTTGVYREVVDVDDVIDDLERTQVEDSARLAILAERARKTITTTPVPEHIRAAVVDAYSRLGEHRPTAVAVRSSATAEDLPHASFAGQQDTYLNVVGADEVLDSVRRCWASLWTDRAVTYRVANGIEHRAVSLAVVVQLMVDAQVAGVLFTANPITGKRTEMVIDAARGLGEAVVSGTVTPDHYRVDTTSGTVEGNGCLSSTHLDVLRNIGSELEQHFGAPQDIEWAIDADGASWVTQSRPITTLFPVPKTYRPGDRVYLSLSVMQGVLQPFTPMGICGWRLLQAAWNPRGLSGNDPITGPPKLVDAGGRIFQDITERLRSKAGRKALRTSISDQMPQASAALARILQDPRFSVQSGSTVDREVLRFGLLIVVAMVRALLRPATARARAFRLAQQIEHRCSAPKPMTTEERLQFIERLPRELLGDPVMRIICVAVAGLFVNKLASKSVSKYATEGEAMVVFGGMPHNPTTEMDLVLWQVAANVRRDSAAHDLLLNTPSAELAQKYLAGALPAAVQDGVAGFLKEYGFRAIAEIDLGVSRWSESPAHVFTMLANCLRSADPEQAADRRFARAAAEAEAKINELVERIPRRRRVSAWVARFVLNRARALAGLREFPKYCVVRGFAFMREQLLLVGTELVEGGRLDQPDDIMFLDLREAHAAVQGKDLRPLVAERRTAYEREVRRRHVPAILLTDGTDPGAEASATPHADGVLAGMPAAPGIVTGLARVIVDPAGAHLEPGEILVAPSTDPGWTPLFLTAGGLVTETGGPISHGPTVAREYGIPAVVGVYDATEQIRTGQQITVDGSAGTIRIDSH